MNVKNEHKRIMIIERIFQHRIIGGITACDGGLHFYWMFSVIEKTGELLIIYSGFNKFIISVCFLCATSFALTEWGRNIFLSLRCVGISFILAYIFWQRQHACSLMWRISIPHLRKLSSSIVIEELMGFPLTTQKP